MLFYSHCNLLADCFLRLQRLKNKQIRGGSLTTKLQNFPGALLSSPHQGYALDQLTGGLAAPIPPTPHPPRHQLH